MIKVVSQDVWQQYKTFLPTSHTLYIPALPETLPYAGTIAGSFDYVPPELLLAKLRQWLRSKGVASVFYFLTERVAQHHPTDYEISISELTEANLAALNNGFENVVTGTDFSWALFMDHEGRFEVRVTIDGPRGSAMLDSAVDATYDLRPPRWLFLLYLAPFVLVGLLWGKLLIRRRVMSRGR